MVSMLHPMQFCDITILELDSVPQPLLILAPFFAAVLLWFYLTHLAVKLPLPPSPPKHWLWGNKEFLDRQYRYVHLATECKQHIGDIISLVTPFETVIVVNTAELTTELLEKNAAVTSNRPRNVMMQEILGWSTSLAFHQHDERFRKMRRVIASALHPSAARSYASQHLDSTLDMLRRIAFRPNEFTTTITDVTGAFIMRLAYGYIVTENDPLIRMVRESFWYFGQGLSRHFAVNDIPILKYLPAWFPGAGFQVFGREGRRLRDRYAEEPFNSVVAQIRHNQVKCPSYTSQLLEAKGGVDASAEDVYIIRWTAGTMFTAGTTTSAGVVASFILLISLHPEIAERAQSEIDSVIGRERIPELRDRDSLPYMEAVLQEVMRMCPVLPLGLPHLATEDIEFHGYQIPKGARIDPNIWAILRDPRHYSSPYVFNPNRYLKPRPDPDPRKYIFGFGRRICPGSHVANNNTWMMCAGLLSVFNIHASAELMAKVDSLGGRSSEKFHELSVPFGIADPRPFSCHITPRDAAAISLLDNSTN